MMRTALRMLAMLLLFLLLLPLAASRACASPPVLDIASEPLTSACHVAVGGPGAPGSGSGGVLLRGAAVAGPAGDATSANSVSPGLYQASFDDGDWSGHLERFALMLDSDGRPSAAAPQWEAGAILTGSAGQPPRPAPSQRKIYTSIVQPDGRSHMVPFEWSALSDAQRAALDLPPAAKPAKASPGDGLGPHRLAYLRGERVQEGQVFRRRSSVLGDSVNAAPVVVGPPAAAIKDAAYAAFYQRYRSRPSTVYIGANDGMLHAFDAADGSELFAYVPDALFGVLNQLTGSGYQHRAYVDGQAAAGLARIGGEWKTVLISAMGGGAQGVFALDASDPRHFEAGLGALWEFTDRDDPMMGNVTTLPQIARFRIRKGPGGGELRDFAVVASGLNNYANDGHRSSAGNGALFLLALDKRADEPWQLNTNYYRLVTPVSEPAMANGLSAPVLVDDSEGVIRYAYGGDLQGNLWRFDFGGNAPWTGAVGPGPGKQPLFVARDAHGARQPISQKPRVVYATGGGYLVLFGTGRMIATADRAPAGFAGQSYYGILDSLQNPPVLVGSRKELTPRVLSGAADALNLSLQGDAIEIGSKGWYLDFSQSAQTGERSVASGVLVNGQLLFNTLVPGPDACAPASSRSYALDVLTGLGSGRVATSVSGIVNNSVPMTGLAQSIYAAAPLVLPQPQSSPQPPTRDAIGQVRIEKPYAIVNAPASGDRVRALGRAAGVLRAGRLSWREVANWRALHEAATHTP